MPLIMALNITTLASLALNGICTCALAWSVTRDHASALVAGIIFGCSPFIAAHLMGHFNLTTAWTIPLFALASIDGVRSGSPPWAIVAGVTLAAMAYIDYYYVVYAAVFAVCVFLYETRTWTCTFRARWARTMVADRRRRADRHRYRRDRRDPGQRRIFLEHRINNRLSS